MEPTISALSFLLKTVVDLYLMVLLLRVLLQIACVDVFNPIHQFVIRITNTPLVPFQKVLPRIKDIDISAIVFAILLDMLKIFLLAILIGKTPLFLGLMIWTIGDLLGTLTSFYFYLILLAALLSWFVPMRQIPMIYILYKLTSPIFALCRKWIPPLGGIDLSPILILICLQLISILITSPLTNWGMRLSIG